MGDTTCSIPLPSLNENATFLSVLHIELSLALMVPNQFHQVRSNGLGGLYPDYTELWVFPASKPRIWIE